MKYCPQHTLSLPASTACSTVCARNMRMSTDLSFCITALVTNFTQRTCYFSFPRGTSPQTCYNFTYSFHLFQAVPQPQRPFGLFFRICLNILPSVILSKLSIQFRVQIFYLLLTAFSISVVIFLWFYFTSKTTVFWSVMPYRLVEVHRHFKGACCLHHQGALMTEAASNCETSTNFYQTTWGNNSKYSHLHTGRRENLKSHFLHVTSTLHLAPTLWYLTFLSVITNTNLSHVNCSCTLTRDSRVKEEQRFNTNMLPAISP
jgi:hypothetical protein